MNTGGPGRPAASSDKRRAGCGLVFLLFVILAAVIILAVMFISGDIPGWNDRPDQEISNPAAVREPLPKGCVKETCYYTDELGLVYSESELLPGLENFYEKTGVQPHVYLTPFTCGRLFEPTEAEMKEFSESKYNELFNDDAHLLFVLFRGEYYDDYTYWYVAGKQAESVFDKEAGTILGMYIDMYYNDQSLTYEQYLSKVFDLTAENIMSVTSSPLIPVLIVLGAAAAAALLLEILRRRKKRKEEEAEMTEEMLNIPLEKFSDAEYTAEDKES